MRTLQLNRWAKATSLASTSRTPGASSSIMLTDRSSISRSRLSTSSPRRPRPRLMAFSESAIFCSSASTNLGTDSRPGTNPAAGVALPRRKNGKVSSRASRRCCNNPMTTNVNTTVSVSGKILPRGSGSLLSGTLAKAPSNKPILAPTTPITRCCSDTCRRRRAPNKTTRTPTIISETTTVSVMVIIPFTFFDELRAG